MNLARHLIRSSTTHPDLPAIYFGKSVFCTYSEFSETARRLAGALRNELGLLVGDHVALVLKNTPEFLELLYGIWHAGLVAVPISPKLHARELTFILENSKSRVCFASPELAPILTEAAESVPSLDRVIAAGGSEYSRLSKSTSLEIVERLPADPAWIVYTSGTTGRPKGAVLSHRNLLTMSGGYCFDFESLTTADRLLHLGPMCHGSGMYIMGRVAAGGAQVLPESMGFDPDEVFDLLEAHANVSFFAAPTIVNRLVGSPRAETANLQNLRTIVYGGAPMYVEDMKRALSTFGPRFAQVYGQAESPMAISVLPKDLHVDSMHPDFEERLASVGVAQSVVQVRIAGPDGEALNPGELGEVLVRGDTVMTGYWNNPEATAAALRDGWLHTGDVGVMDSDGFITLKDRSKDLIITGGFNVYPREVEEVLLRHPSVAEVSVIGQPDEEWGEAVVAFIACMPGSTVTGAELNQLCLDNIARYKRPKVYRFLESLPKNHIGKILKTALRAEYSSHS